MATDPKAIIAAARGWIGTPYHHQASVKGVGCDCLGLLRGVFRELKGYDAETPPPYSQDWAEALREETMRDALARHLKALSILDPISPGDVVLFRMIARGPAKHCGIVGENAQAGLTLIHSRHNKRVSEEAFSLAWRRKLAFAFELP
jgi:NlpC/P60 family putative phage cell wall peptidase